MPRPKKVQTENFGEVCGHVNEHSLGVNGLPDGMSCFLPAGHTGNHRGRHKKRTYIRHYDGKHLVDKKPFDTEEESEWLNGAGVPVKLIPTPKEIKPPSLAEQEFGGQAAEVLGSGR